VRRRRPEARRCGLPRPTFSQNVTTFFRKKNQHFFLFFHLRPSSPTASSTFPSGRPWQRAAPNVLADGELGPITQRLAPPATAAVRRRLEGKVEEAVGEEGRRWKKRKNVDSFLKNVVTF
jgi:hypothetical protein